MSAIRGRGNKSTELRFLKLLKENKITGWRRHYRIAGTKPDFVFLSAKLSIFLDGCYWHMCPEHYKTPKSNSLFWEEKIAANRARDLRNTDALVSKGWTVIRVWEHDLKGYSDQVTKKVSTVLAQTL